MEKSLRLNYYRLNIGEHEALIERTVVLLEKILGDKNVRIFLYESGDLPNHISSDESIRRVIYNKFKASIGHLEILDLQEAELTSSQAEIITLVIEGFICQLELINHCETVGIREKLINLDHEGRKKELEEAYLDLNLAHEELSELFNQTFLLNATLSESMEKSLSVLDKAPIAVGILRGRELNIEYANELILQVWGKDKKIVGLPLAEGLPELAGQPYLEILDQVFLTGKRYIGREARAKLKKNGEMVDSWFNFFYEPVLAPSGGTNFIIIIANEITELMHH